MGFRRWDRSSRIAAVGVLVCAVVATAAVVGAVRVEPPDAAGTPDSGWGPLDSSGPGGASTADSDLVRAVSSDPFREARAPASRRYVLPRNRRDRSGGTRTPDHDRLRLEGTAVMSGRPGLAAFRLPSGESHVVRSGGAVNGLDVVRVDEGSVVLRGPDTTLVLRVGGPDGGGGSP